MIIQFSVSACLLMGLVAVKTEKKIFNPMTMLAFLWGIIILFSSLRLYTLYEASEATYNMILLGLVSFFLGFYVSKCITRSGKRHFVIGKKEYKLERIDTINYRIVYFFFLICILYELYQINSLGMSIFLGGMNLSDIGNVVANSSSNTGLINAISFLVINPLYLPLTILFAVDFWDGRRDKIIMILTVIMTIGRIFVSGGRQAVIQLFLVMIVSLTFSRNSAELKSGLRKKFQKARERRILFRIAVVAIIVFGYLTLSKTSAAVKTLFLDFAMQPYMFEYWGQVLGDEYAYGCASMFGFIHPILYIAKNLFHIFPIMPVFFSEINNMIDSTFSNWVSIGQILHANAYTSVFWYLYYDAREFGIALGMLIFGFVSYISFVKAKNGQLLIEISRYCMFAVAVVYTFVDFEFSKASFVLGFIYLNLLLNKRIMS